MKMPYPMVAAVATDIRHQQMEMAIQHNFPRLQQAPIDESATLHIACYGPSLADTYKDLGRPILSMSGATRWLAERGIIADYHCDMDPRSTKILDIIPPIHGVHYLMASVCPPQTWWVLRDEKVTLWHAYSAPETYNWVAEHDDGNLVIRGGQTIGLTALHLGGLLGYRHFEIHGMDGSFRDLTRSERHAGPHYGTKQIDGITWQVFGVQYATSKIMSNAVTETLSTVKNMPIFCVFHGTGLTQALIRKKSYPNACCADEAEKANRIRRSTATVIDPTTRAWDRLYGGLLDAGYEEMKLLRDVNERRRALAKYDTGSVTLGQMMQLRAISKTLKPSSIVAEVGTFIGNSTTAIIADRIYTCDRSNDCLAEPFASNIKTFPYQESTEMLGWMAEHNLKVDLFFFDGRIQLPDLPLILRLSHPDTLYLFDDYVDGQKGVANVKLLTSILPQRYFVMPDHRLNSSMAAIGPMKLFQ